MLEYILELFFFSMLLNIIIYLFYKFYISKRILRYIEVLDNLNDRINKVTSKRREKLYRKLSKDIKRYNNSLYFYSMLQSLILLGIYIAGLLLVFSLSFNVYLPFSIPILTERVSNKNLVLEGPILIYILSFLLFTPLSLRRPKANIN
ncbi:hypothetical protein DFR87_06390 [Metallosphaera hakonensis JCM 8857 = DSM 7519]|uniref:DUF106 domain-containing protein n=1 Tax=Metallosphaera hakonensis JCM 8857 = DSM 7519 TaxID=1293036 RepID=A0A2U9ITK8_9CREN|nr:hypothetical protein DFR87_06390 [Metallosphaera hakonensis JCM 8857 = DSM 7519]